MRILLSAFACKPHSGSETGVGWRWACELAKQHDVFVLTDISRREAIETEMLTRPNPRLKFHYFRPAMLRRIPLGARTANLLYLAWQFGVVAEARRLHQAQPFDYAQHLTYGVFRNPSFLGSLGIPFVFGPVGGGEHCPWVLTRSMPFSEKLREYLRAVVNGIAYFDPFLRRSLAKATLILTKTPQTRQALPRRFHERCIDFLEIGIDPVPAETIDLGGQRGERFRIVFAGRLLGLKGVHLALQAIGRLVQDGRQLEFHIIGEGPMRRVLESLAQELGISDCVHWHGLMPQAELFKHYREMDCLLFPSLHDSSGNVVLEAMSFGLPVICLDLGGPPEILAGQGGIVVATGGLDESGVATALAGATASLMDDAILLEHLRHEARRRSECMTWERRINDAVMLLRGKLAKSDTAAPTLLEQNR